MIAAGIVTVAWTSSVDVMFGTMWREDDRHVAGAVRDRGAHVVLLPERQHLAARDADEAGRGADAERDRRVEERRPEDRREPDREDQERKREQHVRHPRDHGVDPAAVVAGDEPDRDARSPSPGTSRARRPESRPARPRSPARGCRGRARRCRADAPTTGCASTAVKSGSRGRVRRDPGREDRHRRRTSPRPTKPSSANGRRASRRRSRRRRRARGERTSAPAVSTYVMPAPPRSGYAG